MQYRKSSGVQATQPENRRAVEAENGPQAENRQAVEAENEAAKGREAVVLKVAGAF